jgi:dienelactone hydrolase
MTAFIHHSARSLRRAATLVLASVGLISSAAVPDYAGTIPCTPPGKPTVQLNVRLFKPVGPGPFPAVVVMHGSTGMWSNGDMSKGMITNLEWWADWFKQNGYVAIFVDSFTNRLPSQDFKGRRPAVDLTIDDAVASPAYVRPHDAYAARAWLVANSVAYKVNTARFGLLGFSHGGESIFSAVVDDTVIANKPIWTQSQLQLDGTVKNVDVPAPSFHPANTQLFQVAVAYYPGCLLYGYYGPSLPAKNRYMPHCPMLLIHGTLDPLKDFAPSLQEKSALHAISLNRPANSTTQSLHDWLNNNFLASAVEASGVTTNPMTRISLSGAKHSFDNATPQDLPEVIAAQNNGRLITQNWLHTYLK